MMVSDFLCEFLMFYVLSFRMIYLTPSNPFCVIRYPRLHPIYVMFPPSQGIS